MAMEPANGGGPYGYITRHIGAPQVSFGGSKFGENDSLHREANPGVDAKLFQVLTKAAGELGVE